MNHQRYLINNQPLHLIFFISILLISTCLFSQNSSDSEFEESIGIKNLKELYIKAIDTDTEKALSIAVKGISLAKKEQDEAARNDFLLKKANAEFRLKQYDNSINTFKRALVYYQSVDSLLQTFSTLRAIGNCFYDKVNRDSSLFYHLKAREVVLKLDNKRLEAQNLNTIGHNYWYLGYYTKAVEYFQTAIVNYTALNDSALIARIYNNIGTVYWGLSVYDLAMEYYQKSLSIRQELGLKKKSVLVLNNIGMVLEAAQKPEEAFKCFTEALEISSETEYFNGKAYSQINLASYYRDKKRYTIAMEYLDHASANYLKAEQKHYLGYVLKEKGDLYHAKKDFRQAIEYYEESVSQRKQYNFKHGLAETYSAMGKTYLQMGDNTKSILFSRKSLLISLAENYRNLIRDDYLNISKTFERTGNYQEAFSNYKKSEAVKDSIFADQKLFKLQELQIRYEMDKKEKENALLRAQSDLDKLVLNREIQIKYFLTFIALLVIAILGLIYWKYSMQKRTTFALRDTNLKIRNINYENEELINELKQALEREKTLKGLLPICASCKKIRNDKGYWDEVETYISHHADVDFTHSICPDCTQKLYPEFSGNKE